MPDSSAKLHRIVIVGGGAGGLELATMLGNSLGRRGEAEITLVDAARTHIWKPLLHQVAAGSLDTHADEIEFLAQARWHAFAFRLGRMEGLDRANKLIQLAPVLDSAGEEVLPRSTLNYDTLVLAVGSHTNDFGTLGAAQHAIMLDSPEAAKQFNEKLINSCLRAQTSRRAAGEGRLTVTIIGGGATGVELAAELHTTAATLSGYGLANVHPERDLKIVVVEAADRLLPQLPEKVSTAAARELRLLNVDIHSNERVVEVSKEGVRMASGKFIPSTLTVWAAGIKGAEFLKDLDGLESNRINQLQVTASLKTTRDPDIFAMGDCASCPQGEGRAVPPRAQAAHQQAVFLSKLLPLRLAGKNELPAYVYKDQGSLVSISSYSTVGSLMGSLSRGGMFVEGRMALMMYWSLHKKHQVALNGWFKTWLRTWGEVIDKVHKPRIKLH